MIRMVRTLLIAQTVLAVVGCASVHIKRITKCNPNEEGLRFYRPRPYLVVNQPMPVGGGDFFVTGQLQGDRVFISEPLAIPDFELVDELHP